MSIVIRLIILSVEGTKSSMVLVLSAIAALNERSRVVKILGYYCQEIIEEKIMKITIRKYNSYI